MSIQSELKTRFNDAVIEVYVQKDGKPGVVVAPESLAEVCRFLHDSGFDHLSLISGIDRVEWLEVIYHIWSYTRKENVVLKVKLDRDKPVVDSVASVWRGAN
ncbi:MAG TPA: NADH-quinone oxidoreductase subunit C, partial [Candidatus Methanoperedenaceae archaeon]|nr:NADH-quinone oxidoreductase subunit C [Candidatus Methanoperedenaceae archaeon]